MPHGYCYLWDPWIVWLNVISDSLIVLSYYCIPIVLIYFIRKRRDLPFNWIFWMFGGFILACGTTHLMEVWNIWHASYLLSGIIKAITAAISVATAIRLVPLVPQAVAVPNLIHLQEKNRKLECENAERKRLHDALVEAPLRRSATNLSRTALGVLVALALTGVVLLSSGRKDYPDLHTILDTGMFLLSGLLALLFWDIGARGDRPFPKWIAVTFALTSVSEFLHALSSLQWSGVFASIAGTADLWRPATWPPAAHLLPIGIGCSVWLMRRGRKRVMGFALCLIILAGGLFAIFHWLPRYAAPTWLGITRPTLILVPLLWTLVGSACWRLRAADRMFSPLALMAIVLLLASISMLYSRAPHDTQAMVSHLARVGGYLTLLLSLMQMASFDMLERVRSERELAQLNEQLEGRVLERTSQLQSANQSLGSEIAERARDQEQLRASEEWSRMLLDAVKDYAIYRLDPEGRVTSWNAGAARIKGYQTEEVLGKHFSIFYPAAERETGKFQEELKQAVEKGRYEEEGNRVRKDGSVFWASVLITPMYDAAGVLRGYSKVSRDISERKRAEEALRESEERQAGIIGSAMDAIITVDSEQRIVLFNHAAEKMFRCPAGEALGQSIARFIPQRFHAAHGGHIRKFGDTGVTSRNMGAMGPLWAVRADGQEFQIEASISQILTGGKKLFTVILRDVTERVQAEQVLRETQARMTGIIASAMDSIITVDRQQCIVLFNAAAEKMFRCPAAEALGQSIERFIPQRFRAAHSGHIRKFEETGVTGRAMGALGTLWAVRTDGEEFQIEASISQIDAAGKKLFTVILRDVTERKQAETALVKQAGELSRQAEELMRSRQALEAQTLMLQSVLDSISEGLIAADEQGKFVIWNPAAQKILGMDAANLPPERWTEHYGAYLPDMVTPFPTDQLPLVLAIQGEANTAEMFIRNHELAHGVWIEASAGPLKDKDGVVRGGVVAFRDITQRRADGLEIRKLNDELEERVILRTSQLETANRELESFTYSVSHDLRAPLRHIGGFSRILVEEFGAALDPQALHYLQRIQEGTLKMGVLVDEMLNLAQVGRYAVKLQLTELNAVVDEVVTMLKPETDEREIEWKIGRLPRMQCDPVLIKQVFQNLLANALKFTRTRRPAVIEVGHLSDNEQSVVFIRDNGVGFSMKYADKLFGVFQRLHRVEDFEGTGVGLATVQRIIQKHGGQVWAEAEPDRGATFYFSLGTSQPTEPIVIYG